MSYQALARRWRPRHFREVIGQDHVVGALANALDQDRVHHAFLFSGTRGVGKTTLARLLAKALNCKSGVSSNPCGECSACQSIEEGRFIDLIEIDAASRTRVDDTREILDNVQYAPTQGSCKVYLIDEVHMLSTHSFNALLKTLEEPPAHVKFLLATTDPRKLPATVLSRCLQFNLRALDTEQICQNLEMILTSEEIAYEKPGLSTLARVAAGSMRDGLSLLDQAIAFGSGSVMKDQVREMLGMMEDNHVEKILDAIAKDNASAIVQLVKDMGERSIDYIAALDEVLLTLHVISLCHVARDALEAKGADTKTIIDLAEKISVDDAQFFYQIGLYGKRDFAFAPDPATGFEMTLLRMLAFRPIDVDRTSIDNSPNPETSEINSRPSSRLSDEEDQENKSTKKSIGRDNVDFSNPDIWAALVQTSHLESIARELAMNMAPVSYDKNVLSVVIAASVVGLHNQQRQTAIENAVTEKASQSIVLKIIPRTAEVSEIETPAVNGTRHAKKEKSDAYESLMKDSTVQEVIERFDATVILESVKPGNQRG